MTEATRLLVVGEEPPAPLVERLSSEGSVDRRSPTEIAERFDPLIEADAIVVTDGSARDALSDAHPPVPIVGYGVDADEVVGTRVDDLDVLPHVIRGAALNASAAAGTAPVPAVDDGDSRSRLERLHEGTAELVGASDEEAVYASVARIARDLLGYDFCYIGIVEDGEFVPAVPGHAWQERFDVEFGVLGETYRTGEPRIIDDVGDVDEADPRWTEMRSVLSVPFGDRGVFQAASDEPSAFDDRDLELLRLLLSYAENTLARIESEAELRASRRRVTDLHEGVTELTGLRSADAVFEKTVEIAQRVLDLDRSSTLRAEDGYLHAAALSEGAKPGDVRDRMPIDDSSLAGITVLTGESRLVADVTADEDAAPAKPEYRSGLSVPMGEHGVFQAVSIERDAFDERDLELAELLASHAAETLTRIEAHERLRRERDRFSALFENVPDAAVAYEYVDGEPIVRQVNPSFEDVFGWGSDAVVGESIDDFILPDEEDAMETADRLNDQLRRGQNVREEVRRRTADGDRYFLIHVIPVQLDAENISGYAIYTDVTERREYEQRLERQNERLDQFASIVSHDLRNPLSVATGYLELARETGDEEHFDRVEAALDRMDHLVEDLLSLARKGEVVGERREASLRALAERAWANVATADAELVVEEDRTLEVDPDRATELLENLFRNAVEHGSTAAGENGDDGSVDGESGDGGNGGDERLGTGPTADADGGAPTVRVGPVEYRSGDEAGFYVEDDGPGIPEEEREKVFETGYTSDESGTGLGLAITRHIAEAHGWDVRALNGHDGGARFEFKFDEPREANAATS